MKTIDKAIKICDALEMTLEVKVSNYKDGIRIDAINHYWDKSYYAFWDGNKLYSFSEIQVQKVKWILKQLNVDPRNLTAKTRIYKRVPVNVRN